MVLLSVKIFLPPLAPPPLYTHWQTTGILRKQLLILGGHFAEAASSFALDDLQEEVQPGF